MPEQLFRLDGDKWDLDELVIQFQEGEANVKKIEDAYYLSVNVEEGKTKDELRNIGKEALNRINAICLMNDSRFRSPTLSGITHRDPESGRLVTPVELAGTCEISFRGRATVQLVRDGMTQPRQTTFAEHAFRLSSNNESLSVALETYRTVGDSWAGLYSVLDTIQSVVGKIPTKWATAREVSDFTGTANSYHAIGTAARHGLGKSQPMTAKMSIQQARALIQKILRAWIESLITARNS